MKEKLQEMYSVSPYKKGYKNATKFDFKTVGKAVYGEITQQGTDDMVKFFSKYFNADTVFYDLGSGLGKMVIHIGLQYGVKKSVGIEYSNERQQGAIDLKERYARDHDSIAMVHGNMLHHDITDATVIYVDNTVLPDELMERLYKRIPTGCLLLYKKLLRFIPKPEQNHETELVERTYPQKDLRWIVK